MTDNDRTDAAQPPPLDGCGPPPVPPVGSAMPDGTIYAGVSPDTGRPLFAAPHDGPLTRVFREAQAYADRMNGGQPGGWRVPTHRELLVLFRNRAAIGNFSATPMNPRGAYWSSTRFGHSAMMTQRFHGPMAPGTRIPRNEKTSLRLVRG